MKRMVILGLSAAVLAFASNPAFADGWTSKTPPLQRVFPKWDHLKAKKTPTPAPKKENKAP